MIFFIVGTLKNCVYTLAKPYTNSPEDIFVRVQIRNCVKPCIVIAFHALFQRG